MNNAFGYMDNALLKIDKKDEILKLSKFLRKEMKQFKRKWKMEKGKVHHLYSRSTQTRHLKQ